MPKPPAKLTFNEPAPEIKPADLEFLTQRIEALTSLLARLIETTSEITASGIRAKNRCYYCSRRYNHNAPVLTCPCVCHQARNYLSSIASEN